MNRQSFDQITAICIAAMLHFSAGPMRAEAPPAKVKINILQTPSGVRFGMIGEKGTRPAPTLFVFGAEISSALGNSDYNKIGHILQAHGFLSVSLDVPGHGTNARPDEPKNALSAWRARTEKGEDWIGAFSRQVRDVLDHLVKEGYTDPNRVAVAGTSRGGFIAGHVAAADPRSRAMIAYAPVTEAMVLREFKDTPKADAVRALNLVHLADKLAGRSLWVCIGNNDARVGTDEAIAFTRKVVAASLAAGKPADVFLVITPSLGHTIHKTAHEETAAWLLERLKETK